MNIEKSKSVVVLIEFQNEAPRRKRTGYQNGIKTNLDDGGKRSFSKALPAFGANAINALTPILSLC